MLRVISLFAFCFAFVLSDVYPQQQSDGDETCIFPISMKAYFKGDLSEFIKKNLCYPNKHEGGKVFVSFEVDKNGNVVNPKILKGLSEDYNNEALRIFKIMPQWEPAINEEGRPVRSKLIFPVKF